MSNRTTEVNFKFHWAFQTVYVSFYFYSGKVLYLQTVQCSFVAGFDKETEPQTELQDRRIRETYRIKGKLLDACCPIEPQVLEMKKSAQSY